MFRETSLGRTFQDKVPDLSGFRFPYYREKWEQAKGPSTSTTARQQERRREEQTEFNLNLAFQSFRGLEKITFKE